MTSSDPQAQPIPGDQPLPGMPADPAAQAAQGQPDAVNPNDPDQDTDEPDDDQDEEADRPSRRSDQDPREFGKSENVDYTGGRVTTRSRLPGESSQR